LIFIFFAGCKQEVIVPPPLIGIWKTSSPQYADRYLKFTENTLTYGIGDGEKVSHNIEKIDVNQGSGETIYSFHYKDAEGDKWTLTLTYNPASDGTITLQNKNDIWVKVKPEGTG
jgi:hypothetical protein